MTFLPLKACLQAAGHGLFGEWTEKNGGVRQCEWVCRAWPTGA